MSEPISLGEAAWYATLPHRVLPLQNEWFPGLLLRCDEINHWESETTLSHLRSSLKKTFLTRNTNWIVVRSAAFECLGHLLAISTKRLFAMTYQAELARLYHPALPHAAQLWKSQSFHLCPACIEEAWLLNRVSILPHVTCCPTHQVVYQETCQCGAALYLFFRHSRPFTCSVCGRDWGHLPMVRATEERLAMEQIVLSYYGLFFSEGTPELLAYALLVVRSRLKRRKISQVRLLDGEIKQVEHYELTKASLSYLVNLLVSLAFSPDDLMGNGFSDFPLNSL